MSTAAIIIFIVLLVAYLVLATAILYHLIKFRSPGDLNAPAILIFIAGSLFFVGLAFLNFFSLSSSLIK
jgi:hypothetical protein